MLDYVFIKYYALKSHICTKYVELNFIQKLFKFMLKCENVLFIFGKHISSFPCDSQKYTRDVVQIPKIIS